jgi:hypothetical protein
MAYKKEDVIGLMEMISTTILIYINWYSYYNYQKMTIQLRDTYMIYLSITLFASYFLLLTSISYLTHLHLNPFTTLFFWRFKLIKKRRVF